MHVQPTGLEVTHAAYTGSSSTAGWPCSFRVHLLGFLAGIDVAPAWLLLLKYRSSWPWQSSEVEKSSFTTKPVWTEHFSTRLLATLAHQ